MACFFGTSIVFLPSPIVARNVSGSKSWFFLAIAAGLIMGNSSPKKRVHSHNSCCCLPADPPGWFGRVSLGESTHKRRSTVKIWALRNWRRVPNPDFFRGGMAARGGVLARAATPETLYTRVVVAFVRNRHRRTRMKLTLDLLNRSRHAPTKLKNPTRGRRPEGGATWLAPVRFTRNPSSTGLTNKKLKPCSIFTNNPSVFTTLALRSDWAWTLRTSIGSLMASTSLKG